MLCDYYFNQKKHSPPRDQFLRNLKTIQGDPIFPSLMGQTKKTPYFQILKCFAFCPKWGQQMQNIEK